MWLRHPKCMPSSSAGRRRTHNNRHYNTGIFPEGKQSPHSRPTQEGGWFTVESSSWAREWVHFFNSAGRNRPAEHELRCSVEFCPLLVSENHSHQRVCNTELPKFALNIVSMLAIPKTFKASQLSGAKLRPESLASSLPHLAHWGMKNKIHGTIRKNANFYLQLCTSNYIRRNGMSLYINTAWRIPSTLRGKLGARMQSKTILENSQICWCILIIQAFRRDHEFKTCLSYKLRFLSPPKNK